MRLFQLKKVAFTVCLVSAVSNLQAAGLGNLNLMSGLGEPLNAEVDLLSVKPEELATIQAVIANDQVYAEQSLEKPYSHNGIKIEVTKNGRGEPILKLLSTQPMTDAFLDMLIQVEWSNGRLVKEYTVLLDPPNYEKKLAATSTVTLPTPAITTPNSLITPPVTESSSNAQSVAPAENLSKSQDNLVKMTPEQLAREKAKITYKFKTARSKANETKEQKRAQNGNQDTAKYTTSRGDTLYAIARENQIEGVSLEQMLIGLYQANPDAFISKNIHKLKVGKVLNIPDQATINQITPEQARKQYRAQSVHWDTYKNKLAGLVKQSKASEEESQAQRSAGKVVSAEDKSLALKPGMKDVIKLSAGDAKSNKSGDKSLQDKINALQEEMTAKNNAVKEAQSRTADLEKQVTEMQKLLSLKNDAMQKLQQNAEATSKLMKSADANANTQKPEAKLQVPSGAVKQSNTNPTENDLKEASRSNDSTAETQTKQPLTQENNASVDVDSATTPTTQAAPAKVADIDKVDNSKTISTEPEAFPPGFISSLLNRITGMLAGVKFNPVTLISILTIPLLAGIWWVLRQKRKKNLASFEDGIMSSPSVSDMAVNTVFGNTTGGTVEAGDTSFLTDFSQSAVGGMIDANDVDPIAEAEVYMAYGRDAQAEEILKDAIAKEPKRYELHLKLLEIYQTSKNASAFEAIAGELYANLGGGDSSWQKVAQMGLAVDPNNPLYQSTTQLSVKSTAAVTPSIESNNIEHDIVLASNTQVQDPVTSSTIAPNKANSELDMMDLNFETPALDVETSMASATHDTKENMPVFGSTIAFGNTVTAIDDQFLNETIKPDPIIKTPTITEMDLDFPNADVDKTEADLSLDTSAFVNTMTPKSLDLPVIDFASNAKLDDGLKADEDSMLSDSPNAETGNRPLDPADVFKSVPSLNFDVAEENVTELQMSNTQMDNTSEGADPLNIGEEIIISADASIEAEANIETQNSLSAEAAEEVETKLDLIKAYIDMEDVVGAKELIEEVLKEGTEVHRKRANELLAQIG